MRKRILASRRGDAVRVRVVEGEALPTTILCPGNFSGIDGEPSRVVVATV